MPGEISGMKQRILPALASVTAVIFAAAIAGCNRQPEPPPSGLLDIKHLDGTPPESGWALLQHREFNGWTYLYSPIGDTLWCNPSSGPLIAPLAFANPHQETVDRVVCRTHHHRYGWSPTVRCISELFEYADRFVYSP